MGLKIGDNIIDFNLRGVDEKKYYVDKFRGKRILVVIFTCNHCPYAQAYQDSIKEIQSEYSEKGVQVIAINSNDDNNYPEDSFENMKIRAKEARFNFPYLRDESQEVAREYGAEVTPDVFVFDKNRVLRYRGRIDDNWQNPGKVKEKSLRNAINELLEGKGVSIKEAKAIGCSIKWK